jgi:diguanylate cyclase (GGDEF)-like protein
MGTFGKFLPSQTNGYPLEFLCIPFLIWAALRFGQQEAAVAVLMLSAISIAGTRHGYGPFVRATASESLMLLQAFLGVVGMMTHAAAAVVAEHQSAKQALREARDEFADRATTDPLTGLANYRRFVDAFDAEVERSRRTGRSFALVLFDLDHLKKTNDTHGHLTGTRALCRVGNTMQVHCRAIDTAVRYGGDEFALVLPETKKEGAYQVASRIALQVAGDGEQPPISVSFGVAVYPDDGETMEAVFRTADSALYEMKGTKS